MRHWLISPYRRYILWPIRAYPLCQPIPLLKMWSPCSIIRKWYQTMQFCKRSDINFIEVHVHELLYYFRVTCWMIGQIELSNLKKRDWDWKLDDDILALCSSYWEFCKVTVNSMWVAEGFCLLNTLVLVWSSSILRWCNQGRTNHGVTGASMCLGPQCWRRAHLVCMHRFSMVLFQQRNSLFD